MICQIMPEKTGSGVAMRLYNWLTALDVYYEITLLIISQNEVDGRNAENLGVAEIIIHSYVINKVGKVKSVHGSMEPDMFSKWDIESASDRLKDFNGKRYDAVFVSRLRLQPIWKILKFKYNVASRMTVIDFDDVESIALLRKVAHYSSKLKNIRSVLWHVKESVKLYLAEISCNTLFDKIIVCSEKDANILNKRWFTKKATYVPNCVAPTNATPHLTQKNILNLVFVGTLDYSPNEQGLAWFVKSVLPDLRNQLGVINIEVSLTVVGRNATKWMKDLAIDKVILLFENVASVTPYYNHADIVICPIFHGSGTRIKIIEAFAHKRVVVSTLLGAEGIDAEDKKDILIANSKSSFINSIKDLVMQPSLYEEIANRAFALFNKKYSTESFKYYTAAIFDSDSRESSKLIS